MPGMDTPCHEWTGCRYRHYGKLTYGCIFLGHEVGDPIGQKGSLGTHKVGFFLEHGWWGKPCVLHHCDNMICVRPSHLYEGTNADNTRDMLARGRGTKFNAGSFKKGLIPPKQRLDEWDVRFIRHWCDAGFPARVIAEAFDVCRSNISAIKTGAHFGSVS